MSVFNNIKMTGMFHFGKTIVKTLTIGLYHHIIKNQSNCINEKTVIIDTDKITILLNGEIMVR